MESARLIIVKLGDDTILIPTPKYGFTGKIAWFDQLVNAHHAGNKLLSYQYEI